MKKLNEDNDSSGCQMYLNNCSVEKMNSIKGEQLVNEKIGFLTRLIPLKVKPIHMVLFLTFRKLYDDHILYTSSQTLSCADILLSQ